MLGQLLRPFGYLTIRHPAKKKIDVRIPAVMTLGILITLAFFRDEVDVWGAGGLVTSIQSLVQGLPGFYIAALAAVATFGRKTSLDSVIPEPTPTIDTWYGSNKVPVELTRRRFLCLLFAHLTALSLALSVGSSLGRSLAAPVKDLLPVWAAEPLFYVVCGGYFFLVFQMLVVTLWGLTYLGDKMHLPDATILPPSGKDDRKAQG